MGEYSFTKIVWSGVEFKCLGVNPYSSYAIRGTRYYAPKGKYFVGIQAAVIKL